MATRLAATTGNFTAAGTWLTCDATSLNDSEAANTALTTAYQNSTAFTPGAIVVDGIAIKVASRAAGSPTNTLTVRLGNAGVDVPGTVTTMNVSDIQPCSTTNLEGGWYYFRFNVAGTPTPVTLLAATAYTLGAKLSATTTAVNLYSLATTNWSRQIVTTTTGAPAATDKLIICGDNLAAGTQNAYTVTMDNTATTSFGAVTTQALAVCNGGTLTLGNAASTNYYLKIKGIIRCYAGSTWNWGTSGARLPLSSTAVLEFDCTANGDSGFERRNLSTINNYGENGKVYKTLMTVDKAATATVITVASTAGWQVGDELSFNSTSTTATQAEKKTILTVDSATQITLSAGLTNAHSGTSPTQCTVSNLTRNIKIRGISTSLNGYVLNDDTAIVNDDYVEFYNLGSSTTDRRGIDVQTTTGSCTINKCGIHDFTNSSAIGINISGGTSNNWNITSNAMYNFANTGIAVVATSGTAWVIDSNVINSVGSSGGSGALNLGDIGGTVTNNICSGCQSTYAINLSELNTVIGTFSGNTTHSNGSSGLYINISASIGTISNHTSWRNNTTNFNLAGAGDIILESPVGFGAVSSNIDVTFGGGRLEINNGVFNAGVTNVCPVGLRLQNGGSSNLYLNSTTFGATTTHSTGDIQLSVACGCAIYMNNCLLASSTEIASQTNMMPSSFIGSQKHDQTTGSNKTWRRYGVIQIDTTIFDVTPSVRMTPNNASFKLESIDFPCSVACKSGQPIVISVKVRKSVVGDGTAYNGNFPRLILKKNYSLGITSDTVIATATAASSGAFEIIAGTTPTPTENGVMEFVVDCDGTTGWINYDSFQITPNVCTTGASYWINGYPVVYGNNHNSGFIIM